MKFKHFSRLLMTSGNPDLQSSGRTLQGPLTTVGNYKQSVYDRWLHRISDDCM